MTMIWLAMLLHQESCPDTCPVLRAHPESVQHTRGGSCSDCSASIDQCFLYCDSCAKSREECAGCRRILGGGKPGIEQTWRGTDSRVEKPEALRIADEKAWKAAWTRNGGKEADLPAVDFEKHMIVAIFRGTGLESARASDLRVREFEKRISVEYSWTTPLCGNEPKTTEYLFVKIAKSAKKIEVVAWNYRFGTVQRTIIAELP